ncbi:PFL_4669 family integrating conjugative element protein [Moritella sp. F3]|uniref:PFL_4669 family integrating conjugative element protein n=1 Tax=Moritella sp. F3 TaxID=2718882 RepID=UPI0018E13686|nr:TIGR03761 family integrating conjugative element protein [Moritella sp. F3]GIC77066.1 integrating conjugative element protein [Moritella sp. F1]GIC82185.1 integrating conjugative element protein [Moritella sp. F3]
MGNNSNVDFERQFGEFLGSSEVYEGGETTDNSENLGSLRSDISATVHSKEASMLFTGKEKSKTNKFGIPGVHGFSKLANKLEQAIRRDDPYADYFFYNIHNEISLAKRSVIEKREKFKLWLRNELPSNIQMTNSLNMSPLKFELKFNSQLAFQVTYLIMEQDEYFRLLRLAQHASLIPNDVTHDNVRKEQTTTRRIMSNIFAYKYCDVTRNDAAANNQRWQKAMESMKAFDLPEEFLNGTLRSIIAPPISTRPEVDTDAKETSLDPAATVANLEGKSDILTTTNTTNAAQITDSAELIQAERFG